MQQAEVAGELRFALDGIELAALHFAPTQPAPVDGRVIALHGWLDNAASFAPLAARLPGVDLLALDLAGHGRSGHRVPGSGYPIWSYVADLAAVLDRLALPRVHLLGHSLGASIATLFAGAFPERVASLVLIDGLAPLVMPEERAPQQLAQAIRWRREQVSERRFYADRERLVRARTRGRFPLSEAAAARLVARGSVWVEGQGWCWSHDPLLQGPSDLRLSEAQVRAFLAAIRAPTRLYLARNGVADDLLLERSRLVSGLERFEVGGGHHLHLEAETVAGISGSLLGLYRTLGVAVSEEVL